jgi:hypothetical protein
MFMGSLVDFGQESRDIGRKCEMYFFRVIDGWITGRRRSGVGQVHGNIIGVPDTRRGWGTRTHERWYRAEIVELNTRSLDNSNMQRTRSLIPTCALVTLWTKKQVHQKAILG